MCLLVEYVDLRGTTNAGGHPRRINHNFGATVDARYFHGLHYGIVAVQGYGDDNETAQIYAECAEKGHDATQCRTTFMGDSVCMCEREIWKKERDTMAH